VASYLQRYSVKNDTIGFFGPLGYGELTDAGPAVEVRPGPELLERREVFFENWCIDALAQKLSADPALRPWLAPRLKSSFYLEPDGTLHQPFGRPVRPPEPEARLLAGCDGRRIARDLARDLLTVPGMGLRTEEEVYALLEDLCRRRIVTWALEVPLELHPDRTLEEQLLLIGAEDLRERALAALEDLRRGRDAVALAAGNSRVLEAALRELEETFTRHTGLAPRHHQGQTYAARGLVYEDCRRSLEARFGPELLERLGPPLTLLLQGARWLAGELTQRIEERLRAIHADLRRRIGSDTVDCHIFYAQALASLFLKRERDACLAAAEEAYQERWARVLGQTGEASPERFLRFTAAELEGRCAEAFGNPGPTWSLARYFSPDVLISAAGEEALQRGEYELVLGEVHASNTLLWSCFIAQHPDPARVLAALRRDADGGTYVFPQLLKHSVPQRMNIGVSMPELLWFHFADDPPARGASAVLPAGALVIEERDGRLWACTRDGLLSFPAVDLFSSQLTQECNAAIGDLLPPVAHRPRISVDGVVIARERWRVEASGLEAAAVQDPVERFRQMRSWAEGVGMPRFCFYRTTGERKPCYVDLESPIYVDVFARLVRAAGEGGAVTLTEMMPRLDQIWLADSAGHHYTCELRMVALDADAPQGADDPSHGEHTR
ncbi:MAG TPA: lantibiotic dehydratase, partial [Thermoanaerobaculia bacterium]|nr:lantibiotic dehydratase [Thermoanaerobaculia bacterium]